MAEPATLAVREQFNNPDQQRETATVGMWVFLITEVMLFGGLFTAFSVYHFTYYKAFTDGSGEMKLVLGAVNTAVLICSSFTMAMAVHSAETGKQFRLGFFLTLTILIGLVFLGIKFTEYYIHYQEHKVPGIWYEGTGPEAAHEQLFYVFYFIMTGLHATHMLIGIGILSFMLARTLAGAFSEKYHTPIEVAGLYWHFIDVIWIFLYAIFYIPGAHMK